MKQWVSERLFLLRTNLRYTVQLETAYFFENWAGMISTIAYTVSYIAFINILFLNVPTFAGYSRAEMLFFMLCSQLTFYATWIWSMNNVQLMEDDIRTGAFDLLLTKPIPLLFYAHTRRLSLIRFLRNSPPALVAVGIAVPWSELHFSWTASVAGLAIFLLGQLALNAVQSILILPAFWVPGARVLSMLYDDIADKVMPADAYPRWFALVFIVVLPVLLASIVPAGVVLGRLPALPALALAISATALISWIRVRLWAWALRSYTSASS